MATPQFVDISAFNPASIDWNAYKAWSASGDGISRVAMRSSYGVGYVDAHFAGYRAAALAAGIDSIIYYHYCYPQYNPRPADEANWQHQVVGAIRSQDIIMLDIEENVDQANGGWAYTWLQTQEANYGKLPGIYSYPSFIQDHLQYAPLAKYPLWYANWQYSPDERPPVPAPWTAYEWVQYSDKANIPGISGTVDANIFLGKETTAMNGTLYGPGNGSDFDQWFTVGQDGNWTCKQTGAVIMGGNLGLYRTLSIDGVSLPVIGLPLTSEQYQPDGTSEQPCERAKIRYDPQHKRDSQPGMGSSYLAHIDYSQATTLQNQIAALKAEIADAKIDIQAVHDMQAIQQIADKYK